MPETALTGGTGFIGGALLQRLVADGRQVRALVRSDDDASRVRGLGAEPVVGHLGDAASLRSLVDGCSTLFHVAGRNQMCLSDPGVLDVANVGGTRAVVRAAAAAGVERVVYTSSAATIGERRGVVATEESEHRGSHLTTYERSKHRAEVVAFEESERLGIPVVAVNPSSVQGPGRTGGTARILIAYLRGRLRFAVDTRLSVVSIGDAVAAHLAAERQGEPGERYLVSGWTATVREAVAMMGTLTGTDRRVRYVPAGLLSAIAAPVGWWYRLRRRPAPVCPEMVRALRHGHAYDGSRIEREWGFEYTPPERWLAEAIDWYRAEGLV